MQEKFFPMNIRIIEKVINSLCVESWGSADDAVDDVAFLEEKFGFVHEWHEFTLIVFILDLFSFAGLSILYSDFSLYQMNLINIYIFSLFVVTRLRLPVRIFTQTGRAG